MFLNNLDYQVMIGQRAFDLIQQSDEENRRRAEEMAREEMAGYLRPRYDVERIFARRGEQRNMQIVMFLCDITLYHLASWLPPSHRVAPRRTEWQDRPRSRHPERPQQRSPAL